MSLQSSSESASWMPFRVGRPPTAEPRRVAGRGGPVCTFRVPTLPDGRKTLFAAVPKVPWHPFWHLITLVLPLWGSGYAYTPSTARSERRGRFWVSTGMAVRSLRSGTARLPAMMRRMSRFVRSRSWASSPSTLRSETEGRLRLGGLRRRGTCPSVVSMREFAGPETSFPVRRSSDSRRPYRIDLGPQKAPAALRAAGAVRSWWRPSGISGREPA